MDCGSSSPISHVTALVSSADGASSVALHLSRVKDGNYFLNSTLRLPISYSRRQVRGAGAVHKSARWTGGHSKRSMRQRMDGCPGSCLRSVRCWISYFGGVLLAPEWEARLRLRERGEGGCFGNCHDRPCRVFHGTR
jgi:hypothetical protein